MSPLMLLAVAIAGACGAVARYMIDYAISSRLRALLPYGTWVVNISGSFGLGLLAGGMLAWLPPTLHVAISAGFLGAYTTFSTWMYETVRMIDDGAWRAAVINIIAPLSLGLIAAAAGMALGATV